MKRLVTYYVYYLDGNGLMYVAYRGTSEAKAESHLRYWIECGREAWMTSESIVMEIEAVYA